VFDIPSDTVVIYNLSKLPLELSSAIQLWLAFYKDNTDNRHTIRILQSEARLNRLVAVADPDSSRGYKAVEASFKCPCSVVITTTQERIHDENSTRIFELYADESVEQTRQIVKANLLSADLERKIDKEEQRRVFELHQNAQRMLENIEVSIPYAHLLSFPGKTNRNRRDSSRFMQLIKAVAFLRQKQKEIKFIKGTGCIEADLYDYEYAYMLGIDVIKNTLNTISDRAKNVMEVCCQLTDELKSTGQPAIFTTRQIRERAEPFGYDFSNQQDLYKQLNKLTEYEYLDLEQPKPKGKKYYTVAFYYLRDSSGKIVNMDSPDIKDITTPEQLKTLLSNNK
jgi:hypothetical protein